VDRKQRILPVVENDRPVGVITRTDLLTVMAADGEDGPPESRRADLGRRNVAVLLREHLPPGLSVILAKLGHLADRAGVNLHAVGGCVRDLIMRQPIHDIDLTLNGDLDEFLAAVSGVYRLKKVVRHPRFKTATIRTQDGFSLDLSTTRREYYEHPGALPVVHESSLRMDLYRRDFTINSLAISLNDQNFGEVVDFFRGYQDIKDGYIRVLHSLSFVEDPTRAFRAVRFECRLGFKMSKMTAGLLEGAVQNNFLTNLDRRRLGRELELILSEAEPGPALKRLEDFKLLPFIHPKITLTAQHHQLFTRARQVRDWLALTFPDKKDLAWFIYLMAITDRLRGAELTGLADTLDLTKKEILILSEERPQADQMARSHKKTSSFRPSQACALFSGLSWPTILYIMAKTENHALAQAGAAFLTSYRKLQPLVNGLDLLALGWRPGPGMKEILEQLRRARLDGLVTTRADELAWAEDVLKLEGL
jgi:tRNA nucleotidyltransferase (CCA-adding enzyme)